MATYSNAFLLCCLFVVPFCVIGDTCLAPEVKSQTYTTSEVVTSTETVFIVDFTLACKNKIQDLNLYADVKGKTIPVTKAGDTYQISYSDEHQNLPSGTYDFRLFDEEGYAALRKAQRSGESSDSIKPLYTISVHHRGVWKGPIVQSEFVAAGVAIFVWYMAYNARTKLQSS